MFDVLIKSLTFILIIVIGYTLKKVDVLKKSDANVVATIIMNITLPCALLTSANGIELDATILILIAIGIISNVVMIIIGYIASIKDDAKMKGAFMINTSGYNIGNFVLPFVQSFFPGMGVVYLCSFDIGNALMGLGITYAVADHVASGENHFDIKELFKKLFSSIPFDVYVLIFILAIFKLQIPSPILTIASTIGAGNSFLAMLMIGLMLEIKVSPLEAKNVFKILGLRIVGTIVVSLLTLLLPIPLLAKEIMIMAYCAPLSTVSAVFTRKIGYQGDMSATANSLSILVSIVCMVVLLLIFI
ncbi:AEC family transporter [Longibaculum muris]|uniref:AEC family transporter n=1 Tax=Longibaculum muris TaxID=1796628 RepID=UPI0022E2A2E4|nr:AEC family transporter [Longibaculum muris]